MDTSAYLVPKATSKRRPTSFTGSLDTTLTAEAAIDPAALATAAVATYGLWSAAMTPAVANDPDADAVELGMKFTATTAGSITGLRFYKGAQNTGTHTGSLWTSTGARLGTVTFTNETTSGWQTATFVTPITITANTTYVASYFAPKGHYSVNDGYFSSTYRNGPLTAPAGANGVYTYSRTSAFPTGSYQSSNYWVDVVFQPTTPIANQAPTATNDSGFSTTAGMALRLSTGVLLANDNDPDGDTLTVTGVTAASGGTVTLDAAAKEVVFTPNAGFTGTASFSYAVSDGYGATASASVGVSVNPAGTANAIVLENRKAGSPRGEWDITGGGSTNIQGFAADMSVNLGQTVDFKIKTDSTNYRIDIYRLGYYGGDGARKVGTLQKQLGAAQVQPNAIVDGATGLVDAGNWNVSASWAVPGDAVSGVYVAKLVRQDGVTGASHIPFIVRNDAAKGGVVFQTADTTWQAYNTWGGKSLYYDAATGGRAYKVSYNRPFTNRGDTTGTTGPRDFLFDSEYPMIRWLEANGYDVSYISGLDTDRNGSFLLNNKLFLSVGHDEYWSGQQRANVEAARDAGVNLAFLAGNEMFWKTRWEAAIDGSGKPYRTLVCYKETHADAKIDPSAEWTGTWRDPRFSPPSDGGRPENALIGQLFTVDASSISRMSVSAEDGKLRLWRDTGLASLSAGTSATLTANLLSYEWDEDIDNGYRPAGTFRLSSTVDPNAYYIQDYGSTYAWGGTATHSLTLYRAGSGALVFGAGTPRWSWGLDATHDADQAGTSPYSVDNRIRQATVNLFADMGVRPGTLQSGLIGATQSTDTAKPTSAIMVPTNGGTLTAGQAYTIKGTATDVGGRVAGVEVSVNGGQIWRMASGRSNWTYNWTPATAGSFTIKVRAVDDSGNLEIPGTGNTVTVGGPPPVNGSTIFSASAVPATVSDPDSASVELGVKFQSSQNGYITGIRFYKGPQNTGTHTGSLWTSTGIRLATVTFTNETASGWQQANFSTPVAITAGTTYVASYRAPNGHYSANTNHFTTDVVSGLLRALADGAAGGNGVYSYGAAGTFPTSSWNKSNYWVDVVFNALAA